MGCTQSDVVHMDTTITYEDGPEQRIKMDLRFRNVHLRSEPSWSSLMSLITGFSLEEYTPWFRPGLGSIYKCSGVLNGHGGTDPHPAPTWLWPLPGGGSFILAVVCTLLVAMALDS